MTTPQLPATQRYIKAPPFLLGMEYAELFNHENLFLVVGATNNEEKYGSKVFRDLKQAGYNVVAINKRGGVIQGTPAYPSVTAFLDRVAKLFSEEKRRETIAKIILVLVVPPEAALQVIEEAAGLGVRRAWFQPGAESEEALAYCAEHGLAVVQGQCIMVRRPRADA
ncbi:CoA-binding protein [Candidatus Woesearchaeota archaeon]|nr:MAG: CoA-binding protein [Candidatus Woesearchaeota archaeon]